jgi:hypothetical protein
VSGNLVIEQEGRKETVRGRQATFYSKITGVSGLSQSLHFAHLVTGLDWVFSLLAGTARVDMILYGRLSFAIKMTAHQALIAVYNGQFLHRIIQKTF